MNFEFINSTTINPQVRKKIRSHVMKGRNLGKTRPHKAQVPAAKRTVLQQNTSSRFTNLQDASYSLQNLSYSPTGGVRIACSPSFDITSEHGEQDEPISLSIVPATSHEDIPRPICHEMAMWPMPIQLSDGNLQKIHSYLGLVSRALYPPEFCSTEDIAKSIWIQYMFMDEAYLQTTLALCVTYVNASTVKPSNYEEAIPHISRACQILNQRLSGNDATTDLTIAAVLQLSIYERFQGNYEVGSVHLRGLKHMVELRGGIYQLKSNSPLFQKIFRADFELALHFGTDPLFPASEIPGQDVLTALRNNLFHEQTHNSVQIPSLPTSSYELRDIFLDVLSIDHYLQTRVDIMSKLKPELFQAILIKVCYKLIDNWSVHAQECTNSFEDLLRLTLMAFMITFWYPWGKKSEMFPSLYTRFRKVIEATSQDLVGSESFLLWAVLIGKCSIFSAESDSWLIPIFVKIAKGLELHTWKDTLHAIHGLPWIKFLHEKSGRKLFNDSKAESIQIPSTSNHI